MAIASPEMGPCESFQTPLSKPLRLTVFPGSQCYCKMHYMSQLIHLHFTEACSCFSWNTQAPFTGKVSNKEAVPTAQFFHQS